MVSQPTHSESTRPGQPDDDKSLESQQENLGQEGTGENAAQASGNGSGGAADAKVEELEQKVQEWENRYKYLYAEFENFKKRAQKERVDFQKYGWESLALDLLQVKDNMELALRHTGEADKNLVQGLNMVLGMFDKALEKQGVRRIETVGKPFDPHFHEAVAQETSKEYESGTVMQEQSSGYTLHGRLLRPARVVVAE